MNINQILIELTVISVVNHVKKITPQLTEDDFNKLCSEGDDVKDKLIEELVDRQIIIPVEGGWNGSFYHLNVSDELFKTFERPSNYFDLEPKECILIDESLGILDWEGTAMDSAIGEKCWRLLK